MAKRHSPREPSFTPMSTTADSEDDGMTEVQNPSKRLKTADGSAAASPTVTATEHDDENNTTTVTTTTTTTTTNNNHNSTHNERSSRQRKPPSSAIKKEADAEVATDADGDGNHDTLDTMSSISEDSDGDVPYPQGSKHLAGEDDVYERQVTECAWDGCKASDQQTMDKLVEHLHAEHVEGKQRRYTCEWVGCSRKGKSHASAYALKAHLRSHTREKPYVCYLPECDQAFARADALGKHIRTSHDIDFMRSVDPLRSAQQVGLSGAFKNGGASNGVGSGGGAITTITTSNGGGKGGSSKLKIIIKTPQSHAAGQDDSIDFGGAGQHGGSSSGFTFVNEAGSDTTTLSRSQGFSAHELELPLEQLHGLCRCQLGWAEAEAEELRRECAEWEEAYHEAWLERQVLLDQVIQSEKDWHERRKVVLASLAAEEKLAIKMALHDEETDSAADDYNDNDNGDNNDGDDDDGVDADMTVDGYSFADASSFSVGGSQLRHEVSA